MENNVILTLYNRPETVFTVHEVSQYVPGINSKQLKDRLYHAVKSGKLLRIRKGIYTKDRYNTLELATKIYTPSYISLETVLSSHGVIFQHYMTIFVCSYLTRTLVVDRSTIQLRRMFDPILTNTLGIERKDGYYLATLERAFLDAVYLYKNYHFDNLSGVNWEKVNEYKSFYGNAAFNRRLNSYYKDFKTDYGTY
jgi:predicted transcriptional regulator of viral defense system